MVSAEFLGFGPRHVESSFGYVLQVEFSNEEWSKAVMIVAWIEEVIGTDNEPQVDVMEAIESFLQRESQLKVSVGNDFGDT